MSATLKIFCKNTGEYVPINGGETLLELSQRLLPDGIDGMRPICAMVNN